MSGPKSVIAPTPRKIKGGKISWEIPALISAITPSSKPLRGILASTQPNAIGPNNKGSNSLANAKYNRIKPTRIIIALPVVNARNPLSLITDCIATAKASICVPLSQI